MLHNRIRVNLYAVERKKCVSERFRIIKQLRVSQSIIEPLANVCRFAGQTEIPFTINIRGTRCDLRDFVFVADKFGDMVISVEQISNVETLV